MADTWAAAVLSAGAALVAGQAPWERHQRRQHHARVAARRLHRQAQTDLARLTEQTRARQEQIPSVGENLPPDQDGSFVKSDPIGDFYRVVIAELQTWANEAAEEIEQLRGRRLATRRAALRALRAEIRSLCAEIEAQEAVWAGDGITQALQRVSLSAGLWHLDLDAATGSEPMAHLALDRSGNA